MAEEEAGAAIVSQREDISKEAAAKPAQNTQELPEIKIEIAQQPIGIKAAPSKFSIQANEPKTEEIPPTLSAQNKEEDLPDEHFTETDLQTEWEAYLEDLKKRDIVVYNAISGFKIRKKEENKLEILYPTDLAKIEFDKVKEDFFGHFKRKVKNFKIEVVYTRDEVNLKQEIVTKRTIFEKLVRVNPVLKELDSIMNFDLS